MKNLALIILTISMFSCQISSSDSNQTYITNEAFNSFISMFPNIELPYAILDDKGSEMERIAYDKSIEYLGIKWQDEELQIPDSEIRAVGKFMLNDSTHCLLYRALELPAASGDNVSYRLASFNLEGKLIDQADIAKFVGWDGGYIEQTCTIEADKSITSHYKTEDEAKNKKDASNFRITQRGGVFESDQKLSTENSVKVEVKSIGFEELTRYTIPDIIKKDIVGQFAKGINWKDDLGNNYLIASLKEKKNTSVEDAMDHYLYIKHYVDTGKKFPKVLWKTTDFVKECMFDNMLALVDNSMTVTDLDNDNIAETTYMYTLGCVSDVSPFPLKLIMHEGEDKMAIRGDVRLNLEGYPKEYSYEVDEDSFKEQPKIFRDFAIQHWKEHDMISY